jgi:hypothetical protein
MEEEKKDETPEKKWKIVIADGTPDGMDYDDFIKEMEIEDNKKNFRNWFNKKFPKGIFGVDFAAYYVLTHPWVILFEWKHQIKWGWQRISRGYDDRAVWNLNYHLAKIIPQILKKLKEDKVGIPGFCFEGLPYEDENTYSHSEESMKIAEERWDAVLDEIITGFEVYGTLWELPYEQEREEYKKVERALDLLKEHFESLWD